LLAKILKALPVKFTRNWLGSPEETDVHETLLGSTLTAEKKEFCAQQELAASKLARSPSHRNLQSQYLLVCVWMFVCALVRSLARSCVRACVRAQD